MHINATCNVHTYVLMCTYSATTSSGNLDPTSHESHPKTHRLWHPTHSPQHHADFGTSGDQLGWDPHSYPGIWSLCKLTANIEPYNPYNSRFNHPYNPDPIISYHIHQSRFNHQVTSHTHRSTIQADFISS